jgi:hypothetical protein
MAFNWKNLVGAFAKLLPVAINYVPPQDENVKKAVTATLQAAPSIVAAVHEGMGNAPGDQKMNAAVAAMGATAQVLGNTLTGGAQETYQQVMPIAQMVLQAAYDAFKEADKGDATGG